VDSPASSNSSRYRSRQPRLISHVRTSFGLMRNRISRLTDWMERRQSKKSETFEVRLTYEDKQALMKKASIQGRSASDIVRASISSKPSNSDRPMPTWTLTWQRGAALFAIASAVLAVAYSISSPASADREYRRGFQIKLARLDKNRNGMIDRQEFAGQALIELTPSREGKGTFSGVIHGPPLPSSPEVRGDFAAQDEDGDGRITRTEYVSYRHNLAHRHFGALDANSDGKLSFPEFSQDFGIPPGEPGRKLFALRDFNHDGWLSEQELDQ